MDAEIGYSSAVTCRVERLVRPVKRFRVAGLSVLRAGLSVKEDTDLMIITRDGKIIRLESGEIRQAGRSTQGVRLVRPEEGDQVAAASVIPDEAESSGNGANGQNDLPLQ